MDIIIREYFENDLADMIDIWNEVVQEGVAFPQEELLDEKTGREFFASQSCCGVAVKAEKVVGMYILHPNNVGRCGHICNASYAVASSARGTGIGRMLVSDSLVQGKKHGFEIMQFNAVVASNTSARKLYESLGFVQLGVIPKGFRTKSGVFEDICPYYYTL